MFFTGFLSVSSKYRDSGLTSNTKRLPPSQSLFCTTLHSAVRTARCAGLCSWHCVTAGGWLSVNNELSLEAAARGRSANRPPPHLRRSVNIIFTSSKFLFGTRGIHWLYTAHHHETYTECRTNRSRIYRKLYTKWYVRVVDYFVLLSELRHTFPTF